MIKILINAYACAPNMGSEPGMAWNWIINLSKYCQLHIITEGEWQNEIETALYNLPQAENITFYYNPVSEKIRKICWNQGNWRFYYHYRQWQKKTLILAKDIISKEKVDLIHQLNMVGYREPGLLWTIKGIPKVWGPIGGFGGIPNTFLSLYEKSTAWKQRLKQIINTYQAFLPYIRIPIYQFDSLVACNSVAQKSLHRISNRNIPIISEVGANKYDEKLLPKNYNSIRLKIAWVGKNDERKALPIALNIVKQLSEINIELHIYGIAKEELNIEDVSNNIIFHGWLDHNIVQNKMQECHLLLFTSLFEATGTVVLEALSMGLPVLCHDTCGQGDIINDLCGYKIKMKSVNNSIEQFKNIILELYFKRKLLENLSKGALKRVDELSWENNCNKMFKVYESLLNTKNIY